MWVGGRVQRRPARCALDVDADARRVASRAAELKDGGAGTFWLVTVGHVISQDGEVVRRRGAGPRVPRAPSALAPPGPDRDDAPDRRRVGRGRCVADPVLLFRFSAVTDNAHRIHYDHPYATEVEGYPDLVVHGPLTAILLAEFARRTPAAMLARDLVPRPRSALRQPAVLAHRHARLRRHDPTAAIRADHIEAMTLDAR